MIESLHGELMTIGWETVRAERVDLRESSLQRLSISRKTVTLGLVPTRYQTVFSVVLGPGPPWRRPCQRELDLDAKVGVVRLAVVNESDSR